MQTSTRLPEFGSSLTVGQAQGSCKVLAEVIVNLVQVHQQAVCLLLLELSQCLRGIQFDIKFRQVDIGLVCAFRARQLQGRLLHGMLATKEG